MKKHFDSNLADKVNSFGRIIRLGRDWLSNILKANVYVGRNLAALPAGSIVFFPYRENLLGCGIAAIVSYKGKKPTAPPPENTSVGGFSRQNRTTGVWRL